MSQPNVQEPTVNSPIADLTYRNYDGLSQAIPFAGGLSRSLFCAQT